MNRMFYYQAYLHAHECAHSLLHVDILMRCADRKSDYWLKSAEADLKALADHLGYDMVKREPAKEPAEEAA